MLKYKYGCDNKGNLVDIEDAVKKDIYFCKECRLKLIPRQGKINVWHFAHKKDNKGKCSYETYLHKVSKELLYKELKKYLDENKKFDLIYEINYRCNFCNKIISSKKEKINLIDYYNDIFLEKRIGEFIPDISLIPKKNSRVLFIEIVVSHYSEEKKLHSDYPIVEIEVEHQYDIKDIIKEKQINIFSEKENINIYNFKDKIILDKCIYCKQKEERKIKKDESEKKGRKEKEEEKRKELLIKNQNLRQQEQRKIELREKKRYTNFIVILHSGEIFIRGKKDGFKWDRYYTEDCIKNMKGVKCYFDIGKINYDDEKRMYLLLKKFYYIDNYDIKDCKLCVHCNRNTMWCNVIANKVNGCDAVKCSSFCPIKGEVLEKNGNLAVVRSYFKNKKLNEIY